MIRILKITAQVIWAAALVGLGTTIGTLHGWEQHGWLGATVLGTVGFGIGALFASSPMLVFLLLRGFS